MLNSQLFRCKATQQFPLSSSPPLALALIKLSRSAPSEAEANAAAAVVGEALSVFGRRGRRGRVANHSDLFSVKKCSIFRQKMPQMEFFSPQKGI